MRHIKKFNESEKKFTYGFTIDIEGCTKPNIEKKKDVYEDIASKLETMASRIRKGVKSSGLKDDTKYTLHIDWEEKIYEKNLNEGYDYEYLQYKIEDEGFDYAICYYSNWKHLEDEKFHELRDKFIEAKRELQTYIKTKNG